MFNKKPWITPVSTLDTGKPMSLSSEEDCDENNIPSSTETKIPIKRKRRTVLENMLEENTVARKKMHEEAMMRQDKLLDILRERKRWRSSEWKVCWKVKWFGGK